MGLSRFALRFSVVANYYTTTPMKSTTPENGGVGRVKSWELRVGSGGVVEMGDVM